MTYAGARGETADEMRKVLHFTLPDGRLHAAVGALQRELQVDAVASDAANSNQSPRAKHGMILGNRPYNGSAYECNINNGIWVQAGFTVRPAFRETLERHYRGQFAEADFIHSPQAAQRAINDWVERTTCGRIRDIVSEHDLTPETRMVLANTAYLSAPWDLPFGSKTTDMQPFETAPGKFRQVSMMYSYNKTFPHYVGDKYAAVELPCRHDGTAVVVVLPHRRDGLAEVEQAFNSGEYERLRRGFTPRSVQIELPKLRVSTRVGLIDSLTRLGMRSAFGHGADFGGMCNGHLYLQAALHQADCDMDEKGVAAAAATVVLMAVDHALEPGLFRADHPYLYLISDRHTGTILFLGRCRSPV